MTDIARFPHDKLPDVYIDRNGTVSVRNGPATEEPWGYTEVRMPRRPLSRMVAESDSPMYPMPDYEEITWEIQRSGPPERPFRGTNGVRIFVERG